MKKTKNKRCNAEGDLDPKETPAPATEAVNDQPVSDGEAEAAPADAEVAREAAAEAVDPVQELQAKLEALEDSLLRAKADYQNLVRRSAVERADAIRYANADLMRSLLVVLDDFDRSLTAADNSDNLSSVVEGVRLVHENFLKALQDHGLQSIEALHQPFDPHVHEAMMQQPSAEHPPGTVVEEVARGYRLRDRVIRPAKVVVSTVPHEEPAEGPSKEEEGA